MKFTVREGFVVNYVDRIKQGDKIVEREYSFYPEDGAVDLDKDHAVANAHKLEAADKQATTLLESLQVVTAPQTTIPAVDINAIVTAAVNAALAAQAATAAAAAKPAAI